VPHFIRRPSNQPELQRVSGAELRARTILDLKKVSRIRQKIENRMEDLKLFLEKESRRSNEKADALDRKYGQSE